MTSSKVLNNFITVNYDEIVLMSKKICRSHRDYLEVAHFVIEKLYENKNAEDIINRGEGMKYVSGMIHLNFHSNTSQFHKYWRQSGRVWASDVVYKGKDREDGEYDYETDKLIMMIETLLEEMEGDNIDRWYKSVLFRMYVDCQNYSELERRTGIPRTSISQAVRECREYIKNKLKL